jgi:hypothetical protein
MAEPSSDRQDFIDRVRTTLEQKFKGSVRPQDHRWLDICCPFHPDENPRSAAFKLDSGSLHCFVEDKTWGLNEVAAQLDVEKPAPRGPASRPTLKVLQQNNDFAEVVTSYEYKWPTGELSHYVRRHDLAQGGKTFDILGPDGQKKLPDPSYPIFDDPEYQVGDYLLIVEGEKAALRARAVKDHLDKPIRVITWQGGSGSAKKWSARIAERVLEMQPAYTVLWPDFDEAGEKSMAVIRDSLRRVGVPFNTVKPQEVWPEFPLKGDVVEYLDQNLSLAAAYDQFRGGDISRVVALYKRLLALSDFHFVYTGTRTAVPIETRFLETAWQQQYDALPTQQDIRELQAKLLHKALTDPVVPHYRLATTPTGFFWRSGTAGRCFYVDKQDVGVGDDPEGGFIVLPNAKPVYSTGIDPAGSATALRELLSMFALQEHEIIIEAWLITAFTGLETPILLLRGDADTGKTTLARALLSVIEPVIPEMSAAQAEMKDMRQFVRMLESTPALLIDNVSSMPPGMEDTLSKLVTGTTIAIRPMYEDFVSWARIRRALIMTTVTYDIYKSDLASRTIAFSPSFTGVHLSSTEIHEQIGGLIPRIRAGIFDRCVTYYRNQGKAKGKETRFRVGDIGRVLFALERDVKAVYEQVVESKRELLSQHDLWLEAICGYVNEAMPSQGGRFIGPTAEVQRQIRERTGADAPSSQRLAKYLEEKQQVFKDFGFLVRKSRAHGGIRAYEFSSVSNA